MKPAALRWKNRRFALIAGGLVLTSAILAIGAFKTIPAAAGLKTIPVATPSGAEILAGSPWRIEGDLSEACTCSVPCPCNFGGSPAPDHYCWAIFSLDIKTGHYGEVSLSGLHLAAGNAAKGTVWYLDETADPKQTAALRAISEAINSKLVGYWKGVDPKIVEDPQFAQLGFKTARIVQQATGKGSVLRIGEFGSFESDYLLGIDGKSPIVVENNWSWNIQHGIKGKTKHLKYKDEYGNLIDTSATNANQGKFDWSDQTAIYLR